MRYEVTWGFNTKQLWVYDNDRDCFIDPPADILNELYKKYILRDIDMEMSALEEIIDNDPDWLYDEDYCYYDDDFEI